jgi:putative transcriptional regulator
VTADELKVVRERMNLTQEQLAAYLEVTRMTVHRWESGKISIPRSIELALEALEARLKRPE